MSPCSPSSWVPRLAQDLPSMPFCLHISDMFQKLWDSRGCSSVYSAFLRTLKPYLGQGPFDDGDNKSNIICKSWVIGSVQSTLEAWSQFVLMVALWSMRWCYPHFNSIKSKVHFPVLLPLVESQLEPKALAALLCWLPERDMAYSAGPWSSRIPGVLLRVLLWSCGG